MFTFQNYFITMSGTVMRASVILIDHPTNNPKTRRYISLSTGLIYRYSITGRTSRLPLMFKKALTLDEVRDLHPEHFI